MKRLTKSQYEAIAARIKQISFGSINPIRLAVREEIALDLAMDFSLADDQFDRDKFLALCGIKD